MKRIVAIALMGGLAGSSQLLIAGDDGLSFHDDYYLGFSQGTYYGLMLGGVEYDVAWCVKSELAYEAENMGTGGDFQAKLDAIFAACRPDERAR